MMNFNDLPDLPLRIIFSKLDAFDLVKSRFVCPQWLRYQFRITRKLDSLTILLGTNRVLNVVSNSIFTTPYIENVPNEENKLLLSSNGAENSICHVAAFPPQYFTREVIKAFPSVTKLRIVITDINISKVSDFFTEIVLALSERLTTLEVFFRSTSYSQILSEEEDILARSEEIESSKVIMGMIAFCQSLKHLIVDCDTYFYSNKTILDNYFISDFPPNLETLKFNTLDKFTASHLAAFHRYLAENPHLKYLALMNPTTEPMDDPKWLSISSKWLKLPANIKYWNESIMTNFSSLTSIEVILHYGQDPVKLLNSLAPLKNLIYLCLAIGEKRAPVFSNSYDISKYDKVSYSKIIQLPTVKVLKLKIRHLKYHYDIRSKYWSWNFPNVEVIIIKHKCSKYFCEHFKNMQMRPQITSDSILMEEMRKLIKDFKKCPKLRNIYTNYPQKRCWTVSELE